MKRLFLLGCLVVAMVVDFSVGAEKPKTLIVAIGDSLTAGTPFAQSPLENPPDGSGDPEAQYSHWLMHWRPGWEVRNFGIAGETSTQIKARFRQAIETRPRYIIILCGTNDIYQNLPIAKTTENLFYMYQQAQNNSIMPVAVTIPPLDLAKPEQIKAIEELNTWIKKAAEKMRMPIADIHLALRNPNDPTKFNGTPDGLHPDIGGYRKMGKELIKAIDPIEKAWR